METFKKKQLLWTVISFISLHTATIRKIQGSVVVWFGLFFWWYINLCRLFNAKAILLKEQSWYYLTHSWEDKRVHNFLKGICPKVNIIAWLEFELTTTIPQSIAITITPRGHSHGLVLSHINHSRLFNIKFIFFTYKQICFKQFCLV